MWIGSSSSPAPAISLEFRSDVAFAPFAKRPRSRSLSSKSRSSKRSNRLRLTKSTRCSGHAAALSTALGASARHAYAPSSFQNAGQGHCREKRSFSGFCAPSQHRDFTREHGCPFSHLGNQIPEIPSELRFSDQRTSLARVAGPSRWNRAQSDKIRPSRPASLMRLEGRMESLHRRHPKSSPTSGRPCS